MMANPVHEHRMDFFSYQGLFHADPHPGNMLRTPDGRSGGGFQGKDVLGDWVAKWVDIRLLEDRAQSAVMMRTL